MKKIKYLALIIGFACLSSACGGGGGSGSSDDQPGELSIQIAPDAIDTGDRTTVRFFITEPNPDGIIVKVRFPLGLRYVIGSSELVIGGVTTRTAPTNSVSDSTYRYLTYFFREGFLIENSAELRFRLSGVEAVTSGAIEGDIDLNDPTIDDQDEFSVSTPNFSPLASYPVFVR